jgi:hypothetical protein
VYAPAEGADPLPTFLLYPLFVICAGKPRNFKEKKTEVKIVSEIFFKKTQRCLLITIFANIFATQHHNLAKMHLKKC